MPDTYGTTDCGITAVVCARCASLPSLARDVLFRSSTSLDDDVLPRRRSGNA